MYWTQGVPDFFNNQLQPKQTISCPIVLTLWIKQLLCSNQAIHLSGNLFWSSSNPVIFSLARPFSFFLFSAQKHTRPKPPFFLPSLGRRDNLGWFPPSILSSLARSTIDLITDTLTNDSPLPTKALASSLPYRSFHCWKWWDFSPACRLFFWL